MGVPLPTYGNYGGNGANDAWAMASAYYGYALAHSPENVQMVYDAMYATGRTPIDAYDWAYFLHDVGSFTGDVLGQIINNINMGMNIIEALWTLQPAMDAAWGIIYPILSIPFMEVLGSIFYIGQGIATAVGAIFSGVGAAMSGFVAGFTSVVSTFTGGISSIMSNLGSAVGNFFGAIGSFFGIVQGWLFGS
jgi:hypothetical protein